MHKDGGKNQHKNSGKLFQNFKKRTKNSPNDSKTAKRDLKISEHDI